MKILPCGKVLEQKSKFKALIKSKLIQELNSQITMTSNPLLKLKLDLCLFCKNFNILFHINVIKAHMCQSTGKRCQLFAVFLALPASNSQTAP